MSKRICKDKKSLKAKLKGKTPKYHCNKCGEVSPKDKWLCKPLVI